MTLEALKLRHKNLLEKGLLKDAAEMQKAINARTPVLENVEEVRKTKKKRGYKLGL